MKREGQLKHENAQGELFRTMMEKLSERVSRGYIVGRNPVKSSISSLPSSFSWMMNPPLCLEKTEGRGQHLWATDEKATENDEVGVSEWNRGYGDSVGSVEKKECSFSSYIKEFTEKYREKERISGNNQGEINNRYERVGGLFNRAWKKPTEGIRVEQISGKGTTGQQNLWLHVPFFGFSDTQKTGTDANKGWIGNDIVKTEGGNLLFDKERMERVYSGTEVEKNFLKENTKVLHQDRDLQTGYKKIFRPNGFEEKVIDYGTTPASDWRKRDNHSNIYELWREHRGILENNAVNQDESCFLKRKNYVSSLARNLSDGNIMQLKNRKGVQKSVSEGEGIISGKKGSLAETRLENRSNTNAQFRMFGNEYLNAFFEKQAVEKNFIWNKKRNVEGQSRNDTSFQRNTGGVGRYGVTHDEMDCSTLREKRFDHLLDDRSKMEKRMRYIGWNEGTLGLETEKVGGYHKLLSDMARDPVNSNGIFQQQTFYKRKRNDELKNICHSRAFSNKKDRLEEQSQAALESRYFDKQFGITTSLLGKHGHNTRFYEENDVVGEQGKCKTLLGSGHVFGNEVVNRNELDITRKKQGFMDATFEKTFHDGLLLKKNRMVHATPPLLWQEKKVNEVEQCGFGLGNVSHSVIPAYANGGILSKPHVGLVGEAGPEAIIPLSGNRRSRGIALWEEAGSRLGVSAYAEGGISQGSSGTVSNCNERKQGGDVFQSSCSWEGNSALLQSSGSHEEQLSGFSVFDKNESASSLSSVGEISVPVTIGSVSLQVQGGGSGDVISELKGNLGVLTDEIASELATSLQQVFSNMPLCTQM